MSDVSARLSMADQIEHVSDLLQKAQAIFSRLNASPDLETLRGLLATARNTLIDHEQRIRAIEARLGST